MEVGDGSRAGAGERAGEALSTEICTVFSSPAGFSCGGAGFLTDRTRTVFPVRCENGVSYIYNSLPTSMLDKKETLRPFDFALLSFTVESPWEIEQVLARWAVGSALETASTRGLYNRGV